MADELIDAVLRLDVTTLIVDDPVKRVDNMTMAWGLEARVPFLDHQLVEIAARCPPALKLRDGGKYPLKAIARGRLPDAVIDRPKGYFPMPALKYVRGEFLEFMRDILDSTACRERGCTDATMSTDCWRRRICTTPVSRAASSGTWPCWSSGCSGKSTDRQRTT
jgi:asparagine synthase (glutamine-hydrolysing)